MNDRTQRFSCGMSLAAILLVIGAVAGSETPRNEQAIREVLDGSRKVAHAAWWGYDAEEATGALQAAIDSGAEKVVIEKMPGPWIVDRINLADNQELLFEPGVVVEAKRGAFRGKADALFAAWNKSNIKLTGNGATLRMHRADYDGPEYEKAEWRHVLSFRGCNDVTVLGLTLTESGGDGIYLGAGRNRETNRNVTIRDVVCDRNYRQGISVITAENLLIEDCVLKNTAGTAPAAGIDFEPNHASERLINCVMRNCRIEDNQGLGIHLYLRPLDGTSEPASIRIENCVTAGTNATSASVITSCGPEGPVQGLIEFVNCRFEDEGRAGIRIGSKPPSGLRLRFVDCTLADPADEPAVSAPIRFSTRHGDLEPTGGVKFVNLTVREQVDRPLMAFSDVIGVNLLDISGTIAIERDGQRAAYKLDREVLDQWVPFDRLLEIPPIALEDLQLAPAAAELLPTDTRLPHHRVRGHATYLLHAAAGETVRLRLRHQAVGNHPGKAMPVRAVSPSGREFQQAAVALGEEAEYTFTADATGTFTVRSEAGRHTVQVVSASHPVCIAGSEGRIHLLGTTGDFYFWVPGEVRQFGLRFQGEGDGERLSATVFDAAGAVRWEQADIGFPESFIAEREPAAKGEVWHVRIARPGKGVLEDCHLVLRGVPAVLGFNPGGLLRPAQ
ncbi:MAG: right-handed parallel beta-helix repeat-containing protein [Thermoguttaceae bacterium]|jgi:hypothetical protein|nr:right-handed parallel beta-helix repeat-containing protein [Thermoguttaceae bacterium]